MTLNSEIIAILDYFRIAHDSTAIHLAGHTDSGVSVALGWKVIESSHSADVHR